jgi:myo-inositol 2-dehydrogenase/D-chiro-inositol 1-dehydrogenase
MLKLCVIGAGNHASRFHLPALAEYRRQRPGTVELAAICDREPDRAAAAAQKFGFTRIYTEADELLRVERPDACLALTPVGLNAPIGLKLVRAGIPGLIEKPPGANAAEARELAEACAATGGRLMVSLNRRFEPAHTGALAWIGARPVRSVRVLMARRERLDPRFLVDTGIHVIDAVCAIMGEPVEVKGSHQLVAGSRWWNIRLRFPNEAEATIELAPTAGSDAERFDLLGSGFRAEYFSAEYDQGGWRGWENGALQREEFIAAGTPPFVANGTWAETEAFIASVLGQRPFRPTPAEVLPGIRLCEELSGSAT